MAERAMKTLVTGATGFLGTSLVQRLCARGDEVICVAKDNLNVHDLKSLKVQLVMRDLNDEHGWDTALKDVDVVFHLAGATRARNWKEYYDCNYVATKRFLELCVQKAPKIKRFVHVSSLAAVGPSKDRTLLTEDAPFKPVSEYGKSKMLGEMEASKARDRLPITIVRPSSVYGPRERDMYDVIKGAQRGIFPVVGFRQKLVCTAHSDDIIQGMLLAAESSRSVGETYFIGSEKSYTQQELGEAIAKAVNRKNWKIHVPHALLYSVGAAAQLAGVVTGKQVFLNIQKVRELVQPAWICSVEKAKAHFGFCQNISLEEGMSRTYQWYVKNGWL